MVPPFAPPLMIGHAVLMTETVAPRVMSPRQPPGIGSQRGGARVKTSTPVPTNTPATDRHGWPSANVKEMSI
jgi:hypothetical protein